MKYLIVLIIIIGALFHIGGLRIHTKPFLIEFTNWRVLLGWILIGVGVFCISMDYSKKSYSKGVKEAGDSFIRVLKSEYDVYEKTPHEEQ